MSLIEQATKERMSARNKRLHARQEADGAYVRVKVLLERRKWRGNYSSCRGNRGRGRRRRGEEGRAEDSLDEERFRSEAVSGSAEGGGEEFGVREKRGPKFGGGAPVGDCGTGGQVGTSTSTGVDKEHVGDLPQKWEFEGGDDTDPIFCCYRFQRSSSSGNEGT